MNRHIALYLVVAGGLITPCVSQAASKYSKKSKLPATPMTGVTLYLEDMKRPAAPPVQAPLPVDSKKARAEAKAKERAGEIAKAEAKAKARAGEKAKLIAQQAKARAEEEARSEAKKVAEIAARREAKSKSAIAAAKPVSGPKDKTNKSQELASEGTATGEKRGWLSFGRGKSKSADSSRTSGTETSTDLAAARSTIDGAPFRSPSLTLPRGVNLRKGDPIEGLWTKRALTWAVSDSPPIPRNLDRDALERKVEICFNQWENARVFEFSKAAPGQQADIVISFDRPSEAGFEKSDLRLSFGFYPWSRNPGKICFDPEHRWSTGEAGIIGEPIADWLPHEIGHVLGLRHSDNEGDVMHPIGPFNQPKTRDLQALQLLYLGAQQDSVDLSRL